MKHVVTTLGLVLVTLMTQAYQTSDLTVRLKRNGQFTVVVNGQSQVSNSSVFSFAQLAPGTYPIQVLRDNYWGSPSVLFSGSIRVPQASRVVATIDHHNRMKVNMSPIAHCGSTSGGNAGFGMTTSATPPGYGYGSGHYEPVVCSPPVPVQIGMTPFHFNRTLQMIDDRPFDRDKMMIARQAIVSNGISSEQVSQLMDLLTFESSKLQLAKFAFNYVDDPESYFIVNDGFTFSSSIRELNNFIYGQG